MKLTRNTIDNRVERQMLTGMIVSQDFLREIATVYRPELIEAPFIRTVADWCVEYWNQYTKPPRRDIEEIFHAAVRERRLTDDVAEAIDSFMAELSAEFEHADRFNAAYALDQTEKHLTERSLLVLAEDIKALAYQQRYSDARTAIANFSAPIRKAAAGVDPYQDMGTIRRAFETNAEPLFYWPGAVGQMLNDQMVRDSFVVFQAPEKRGKSWWLNEASFQSLRARCNTALFEVGDMSESQTTRRLHIRLAQRSNMAKYCGQQISPTLDCVNNQTGQCKRGLKKPMLDIPTEDFMRLLPEQLLEMAPNHQPCANCRRLPDFRGTYWWKKIFIEKPLTWREAFKISQRFYGRTKGKHLKLSVHANSTINVNGIRAQLDLWERQEGFVPDVIVIDYADILAPMDSRVEFRHQQNETWKALRALSQERHCLVISATQADADAYAKRTQDMSNFSEDKRKHAHVTGTIGLNQTPDEKRRGIMRLNWIVLREGEFFSEREVVVLQCLQVGCPIIDSFS